MVFYPDDLKKDDDFDEARVLDVEKNDNDPTIGLL
jgi:hypothetical protein